MQSSICDYYSRYYQSDTDNRHIYLEQAVLSTKMMRWFDKNIAELSEMLSNIWLLGFMAKVKNFGAGLTCPFDIDRIFDFWQDVQT